MTIIIITMMMMVMVMMMVVMMVMMMMMMVVMTIIQRDRDHGGPRQLVRAARCQARSGGHQPTADHPVRPTG